MSEEKELFCDGVRQCQGAMYALVLGMVKNREDAADVVQEAILRAYSRWSSLRDRDKFRPWLLSIAHNAAVVHLRAGRGVVSLEQAAEAAVPEPPLDLAARLSVGEAVARLKLPYRTVIHLFYYEDCSIREIADITHTSPVTVRQQLSRGRKLLAQLLRKEDFAP